MGEGSVSLLFYFFDLVPCWFRVLCCSAMGVRRGADGRPVLASLVPWCFASVLTFFTFYMSKIMSDRYETLRKTAVTLQHFLSLSDFIFLQNSLRVFCTYGRDKVIAPGTASNGELDQKICYLAY